MIGIEYFFDLFHQPQLHVVKHDVHVFFLHQPDSMLAADGATQAFYQLKYFYNARFKRAVPFRICQVAFNNIYMQIAIAGMTKANVADTICVPEVTIPIQAQPIASPSRITTLSGSDPLPRRARCGRRAARSWAA